MKNRIYKNTNKVIVIILQIIALVEIFKGDHIQALMTMLLLVVSTMIDISININTIRRTKVLEYARNKTN